MITQEEPLISVRQVARRFGVGKDTVVRWINHNGLPAIRIPGGFRIDPSKLQEWVDKQQEEK
jgi:excisionase family DNA binding protein